MLNDLLAALNQLSFPKRFSSDEASTAQYSMCVSGGAGAGRVHSGKAVRSIPVVAAKTLLFTDENDGISMDENGEIVVFKNAVLN